MDQNFFLSGAHHESDEGVLVKQKASPISAPTGAESTESGDFDCNICLGTARDPIVTLCGHLYCWPCIYKWLLVRTSTDSNHNQQNCPVCKANISISSLVPLYGRGVPSSEFGSKKLSSENMTIPHRPSPSGLNTLANLNRNDQLHQAQSPAFHHQHYFPRHSGGYTTMESSNLAGAAMTSFFNPMIGMLGEMVYARIFGSYTDMFTHPYQNTYSMIGSNSQRMRRQEVQLGKSLHRVSMFLLCCIILCLLLF